MLQPITYNRSFYAMPISRSEGRQCIRQNQMIKYLLFARQDPTDVTVKYQQTMNSESICTRISGDINFH